MTHREKIAAFLEREDVRNGIILIILFNAVILGLETSDSVMARFGELIHLIDQICLAFFVAELVVKLYAQGLRFFRSGWNVFDFIIIGISLGPMGQGLSVLRALRILRVLRVISFSPSIRRVVEGFIKALPGMGSVFLLTVIIFYVSSVMATKLFADGFPDRFGSLGASALTLFQVMTLEGWADGVVRPVMEVYPYSWIFFIIFILVTTFAVINLLVGLVVNAMQEATEQDEIAATDHYRAEVLARLEAIEKRLSNLD